MEAYLGMHARLGTEELTAILNRLRRVEGQARGLQRMLEEDRSCEEVLTQLSATKAALDRVGVLLVSLMMRECLEEEGEDGTTVSHDAVEHAVEAFLRYAQFVK
jgi:DNA-binding FrmR family transcriptional regulator